MAVPLTLSSVPAQTPYVQYVSGSGQTVFPYPFEITQDSDLVCLINGVAQPTDGGYTLTGQGATGGGNLTFTLGQTAGTIVTLYRNISIQRITQLSQNGTFFSANFNNEFNKIYLIMQQLQQSLLPGGNQAFALMVPNSNSPAPTTLLTPAAYANKYLSFDANGNPQPAVLTSAGTLTKAIIAGLTYPQTGAETSAGLTIVSGTLIPSPDVLGYVDVSRYVGIDSSGVADSTTALQNAINLGGTGSSVYVPHGTYSVNGTLGLLAGQTLRGDGWTSITNSFSLAGGTVFVQHSAANIPLIMINGGGGTFASPGSNQNLQVENVQLRDFAMINAISPGGGGIGFWANMARKISMKNVYIASFANSIQWVNTSWLCEIDHVTCIDFTGTGLLMQGSTDDNLVTNSQFSGYYLQSNPVQLTQETSNNTFINCYFQGGNFGVNLSQQDDGAGHTFPMSARFFGCLMEDIICAGFTLNSTLNNPSVPSGLVGNKSHPALMVEGLRAFNSGNFIQTATSTSASGTGSVATLNFAAVPNAAYVIPVGSQINVSGVLPAGYNGTGMLVTASSTTSVSYVNTTTGAQTQAGTITAGAIPNNGQSIVYAQFASQISVRDVSYAVGFSYATTITGTTPGSGSGFYNFFYNNSGAAPVGPVVWEQDNNAVYGTNGANNGNARFRGTTGAVTTIPGSFTVGKWTQTGSISYVGGNTTLVPFQTVVVDPGQWVSAANSGCIIPLRNQMMRFSAQIYTTSAPIGQYTLQLFKNGSLVAILASETVSTASQPLALTGAFYDIPNGTTDYYQVLTNNSVSCTIDNTPAHTWFVAEITGQ